MDDNQITDFNFGQQSIYGKSVDRFTQRTSDVVYMIVCVVFFARYGNMMIGAVHSRPHQIRHACVEADMGFINFLFVQYPGYQVSVRSGDLSTAFHKNRQGM